MSNKFYSFRYSWQSLIFVKSPDSGIQAGQNICFVISDFINLKYNAPSALCRYPP
jgi:hypothetical protein